MASTSASAEKSIDRFRERSAIIGIMGLGYVGLPLACLFADKGFDVVGIDIQDERVDQINKGHSPINGIEPGLSDLLTSVIQTRCFRASVDYDVIRDLDVIFINVETPVDENHIPRYKSSITVKFSSTYDFSIFIYSANI